MSIPLDSISYPYLAIAQHYQVSYARVLRIVAVFDDAGPLYAPRPEDARLYDIIAEAWTREQRRRSLASQT